MTTITHALAPVILVRIIQLASKKGSALSGWDYGWIALAGGLADIINPHYYLIDRLTSWSHGLPFWFLFSIALIVLALVAGSATKLRFLSVRVSLYCSVAYLLHLFMDGLSGGINALYPIQNYHWGASMIPFQYWIPADILNLAIVIILFRYFQTPQAAGIDQEIGNAS